MKIDAWSKYVSKARAKADMTLHEFGEAVGTSWVTIWRWEQGQCMPKEDAFAFWKEKVDAV